MDDLTCQELQGIMMKLIKTCQGQKASRPRIAAMVALNRVFAHTNRNEHLDLRISPLGQWCLQCVKSSIRDLRIGAVYVVTEVSYEAH